MKKIGKDAKDIFARTTGDADPKQKTKQAGPGRPPVLGRAWSKVTVVLFNDQVVFLDRLAADIRERTGVPTSRAEIIRGLIDAVRDAKLDLAAADSEAGIRGLVAGKLGY